MDKLKINLTYNKASNEAIKRFVKKSLLLYNEIIQKEAVGEK